MYIQTVYLPQENVTFVEDWIRYHLSIGVEHFFMYDNTGSTYRFPENKYDHNLLHDGRNKYGQKIDMGIDQALEIEDEIFKKYPVTKITWQPMVNGQIVYGQMEACIDFSSKVNSGLCAFIDIDEFIIKREEFRESRILQKKYDDRWKYNSVFDCDKTFEINTRRWASKAILDMSRFTSDTDIHFPNHDLPMSTSFFNHYNHSRSCHEWLLSAYKTIDPSWEPVEYDKLFITGEKIAVV